MEDSNKQSQRGKSKRKNSNAKESNEEQEDNISLQHSTSKKTRLSDEENDFLELQQRYHHLLVIPPKKRSEDEKKEYKTLQPKYSRQKAKFSHLVEERPSRPTATGAERIQKHRENMMREKEKRQQTRRERPHLQPRLPPRRGWPHQQQRLPTRKGWPHLQPRLPPKRGRQQQDKNLENPTPTLMLEM